VVLASHEPLGYLRASSSIENLVEMRRALLLRLVTLLVVCVIMTGFGEVAVRVVAPQQESWLDMYARVPGLPFFVLKPNVRRTVDTGETHFEVIIDGRGHRIGPREAKIGGRDTSNRRTALVLGDSFTFATSVNYPDSFVARLEASTGLRYINAAVPGLGPPHYRGLLEFELAHDRRPDFVLIGTFLGNDFHDCIWGKDVPVRNGVVGDAGDLKSTLKRTSHLYRLLASAFHRIAPVDVSGDALDSAFLRSSWQPGGQMTRAGEIYGRELMRIATIARKHGIPVFAIVIPARRAMYAKARTLSGDVDYEFPTKYATARLAEAGIPFLDVGSVLAAHDADTVLYPFDGHFTPLGHKLVADAVAPSIRALMAAPPPQNAAP
jgi:lysophospholipase L1-like esterase